MSSVYKLRFSKLCEEFGLGQLTGNPDQIFGGHLHRMYALKTTKGQYAVKALNPQVMLRPEARPNIINAERIARVAARHVPAAPAIVFENEVIAEIDGQYYLVYDWIEGKTIYSDEITSRHCHTMGAIVADIHRIDFSAVGLTDDYSSDEQLVNWTDYLHRGKEVNAPWLDLFAKNIDHLCNWNRRLIDAAQLLAAGAIISHGDLEPKNVMWRQDEPIIIDWEAAGFIHPMHDLIETAVYWSADKTGKYQKHKFIAFTAGYKSRTGSLQAAWPTILDKGYGGKLGWLEYSLKRSLGMESSDKEEQRMGTEHVYGTIRMLHDYDCMKNNIIEWLGELL